MPCCYEIACVTLYKVPVPCCYEIACVTLCHASLRVL